MKFYRIEPIQHETFYVLSEDTPDLPRITHSPICFSPVSCRQELVEVGDIPLHAKIIAIGRFDGRIRRINLETAMQLSTGESSDAINEISAAIDTLKAAMQRNGLNAPISIELQDVHQAIRLASLFGDSLAIKSLSRLITSIFTSREGFLIRGIRFTWVKGANSLSSGGLKRVRRAVSAIWGAR